MRHNISLTKENSELLKTLEKDLGLKPSAVVATALRALKKQESSERGEK